MKHIIVKLYVGNEKDNKIPIIINIIYLSFIETILIVLFILNFCNLNLFYFFEDQSLIFEI